MQKRRAQSVINISMLLYISKKLNRSSERLMKITAHNKL